MTNLHDKAGFMNQGLMELEVRRLSREIKELEKQPQSESGVRSLHSKRMCRADLKAELAYLPGRRTRTGGLRLA